MIKYSVSKVRIIALAALLIFVIAGCGSKEKTGAGVTKAAEQSTETRQKAEHTARTEQAANGGNIAGDKAAADAGVLPEERSPDDYSAEELIEQIKNGETPVLYGGASPEALAGLFADSADGLELEEEEAEELKDFAFEEYEALPYNPDAPWSEEGVVYEAAEGTEAVMSGMKEESADAGDSVSDGYSFLTLPAGITPYSDEADWMVTFSGDADSCREYISEVKKAGYTMDAEDTDMMGILMYEGSNSDGERASVMYTNGSISVIFEKQ